MKSAITVVLVAAVAGFSGARFVPRFTTFLWQALMYALWEASLVVAVSTGLPVLFRRRWNQQGRLAKSLAASAYTVYLIHPVVLVGFAYAFC